MPPLTLDALANPFADAVAAAAGKWLNGGGGETATSDDLAEFRTRQKMLFLDEMIMKGCPMRPEVLARMDALFRFASCGNVELEFRWIMLGLKSRDVLVVKCAEGFLGRHGRGLYVKPIYAALSDLNPAEAKRIYGANRPMYHSVIRNAFDAKLL
jgi:hypothetical protein